MAVLATSKSGKASPFIKPLSAQCYRTRPSDALEAHCWSDRGLGILTGGGVMIGARSLRFVGLADIRRRMTRFVRTPPHSVAPGAQSRGFAEPTPELSCPSAIRSRCGPFTACHSEEIVQSRGIGCQSSALAGPSERRENWRHC